MTADAVTDREPDVFDIAHEADLIRVRKVLRSEAEAAGLNLVDATKLITAGSELARNVLNYATGGRGRIRVERVYRNGRRGCGPRSRTTAPASTTSTRR